MPFDAYEELVDGGTASLRDLDDDFDFKDKAKDDDNDIADLDDLMSGIMVPDKATKEALQDKPMTDEEIEKAVKHDLDLIKMAEESEKEAGGTTHLDVLDDEANEEQYYLEPIE